MNIITWLSTFSLALSISLLFRGALLPSCQAVEATPGATNDGGDGDIDVIDVDDDDDADDDGDEYYNLEDMSDEELEEICTSRGFELVRESDEVYTHQDYVDAAVECLQIEADLEEILETHPEILEDVKRENERMMKERDRLQEQLNKQQMGEPIEHIDNDPERAGISLEQNTDLDTNSNQAISDSKAENETTTVVDSSNNNNNNITETSEQKSTLSDQNNKLNYDLKEITLEVIEQIKSDITKVVNFIAPKGLRDQVKIQMMKQQILPALKSFGLVAKDMGMTAYDMARRYFLAFMNKNEGVNTLGEEVEGEHPSNEMEGLQKEESTV